MAYLYLPTLTPSPLRNESDSGVIATLLRKGWQQTTPPTPGAGQTAQWDGTTRTWAMVNNPPAPPDYAGFEDALKSSAVMVANKNRIAPSITLSTPTTLAELRAATLQLATANETNYAWERFCLLLERIVAQGGDRDLTAVKTRFQNLLWDWLDAGNFGSPSRTAIQSMLDQYLPTRSYATVRP